MVSLVGPIPVATYQGFIRALAMGENKMVCVLRKDFEGGLLMDETNHPAWKEMRWTL